MELEPAERDFIRSLVKLSVYLPLAILACLAIGCLLADFIFWWR